MGDLRRAISHTCMKLKRLLASNIRV